MMEFWHIGFLRLGLVVAVVTLSSCATSKLASGEVAEPPAEVKREPPKPEPERWVGTVTVVKSSKKGRGFVLVRPASKRTKVDVGATLEARDDNGLKTASMIRSAEDNRRFFVADIRGGMPGEGDRVVALEKVPELKKVPSGLPTGSGLPDDLNLSEPLSLPPLSEADIRAMEP